MRTLLALLTALFLLPQGAEAQQARQMINGIRAENGLGPVVPSEKLEKAAMAHAVDMVRNNFFSHVGSDGSRVKNRARRAGYGNCFLAENIAKGQKSLNEVMTSWINSSGHRRNLLRRNVTGYGLVRGQGDVWVLVLGQANC